jgi:hypothetical protein
MVGDQTDLESRSTGVWRRAPAGRDSVGSAWPGHRWHPAVQTGGHVSETAHATDAAVAGHHGDGGHGDGHGDHGGPALGPIDWAAWGAALVGLIVALVIAAALYLAQHP